MKVNETSAAPPLNTDIDVQEPEELPPLVAPRTVEPADEAPFDFSNVDGPSPDDAPFVFAKEEVAPATDARSALRGALEGSFTPTSTREIDIKRFATEAKLPTSFVEQNYDKLRASKQVEGYNFDTWEKTNSELAKAAKENQVFGEHVFRQESKWKQFVWLMKETAGLFSDVAAIDAAMPSPYATIKGLLTKKAPEGVDRAKLQAAVDQVGKQAQRVATADEKLEKPPTVEMILDPSAKGSGLDKTLAATKYSAMGVYNSLLYFKKMMGGSDFDLDKSIIDSDLELGDLPRAFDPTSGQQFAVGAGEILPSMVASYGGALIGWGIGALSETIPYAGPFLGKYLKPFAARLGASATSFPIEAGGAFKQFIRTRTDDGELLTHETAREFALIYGVLSTMTEQITFGAEMGSLGALGDLIKNGDKQAFARAILKDRTLLGVARDLVKRHGNDLIGETSEEVLQGAEQGVMLWAAKSDQAGAPQAFQGTEFAIELIDTGIHTAVGMAGLAAPKASFGVAQKMAFRERALRSSIHSALQGDQLLKAAMELDGVKAQPEATAQLVKEASASVGQPIDAVHVDPVAVQAFFQEQGIDPAQGVVELLGEGAAAKLQTALETGENLEVSTATFFKDWVSHPISAKLAGHVTTRPGGLTTNQQVTRKAEIEAEAARIEKQFTGETLPVPESPLETEQVNNAVGALMATGQTREQAYRSIMPMWKVRRVWSATENIPIDDILQEFPITTEARDLDARNESDGLTAEEIDITEDDVPAVDAPPAIGMTAEAELQTSTKTAAQEGVAPETKTLNQAVTLREGKETLEKFGIAPTVPVIDKKTGKQKVDKTGALVTKPNKVNTRDLAVALQERQRKKYGETPLDDFSAKAARKIAKWMAEEILFEARPENAQSSGAGWYSTKWQRAIDAFSEVFPELKDDKDSRDIFTALMALSSDGQKVNTNFKYAAQLYDAYRKSSDDPKKRRMPTEFPSAGARRKSFEANLAAINELLDQGGLKQMREYLLQEGSVSELRQIAKEKGLVFKTEYKADTMLPMSAVVFGPKLGAFYANLMGATGYLTMDRWWSRTFNRYRGNLVAQPTKVGLARFKELIGKPDITDEQAALETVPFRETYEAKDFKDGTELEKAANTIWKAAFNELEDTPQNASDREFMITAVREAQKLVKKAGRDISIADIQAILWYFEKRLYAELGVRASADISYQEAAAKVVNIAKSGKPFDHPDFFGNKKAETNEDPEAVNAGPEGRATSGAGEALVEGPDGNYFEVERATVLNQEEGDERNLIVHHNIRAAGLLHADELGGLPAPSLAVSRSEHPLAGFGEITLVGDSDLVNPRKGTPVFDADIYSPRFPTAYNELDKKGFKALMEELQPSARAVNGYVDDLDDQIHSNPVDDVIRRSYVRNPLMHLYLKELGVAFEPIYFSEKELIDNRQSTEKRMVNKSKTAEALAIAIYKTTGGEEAFDAWATQKVGAAVKGRFLKANNRKLPYTLQNILRQMTKTVRGGEGVMYGMGPARARGAYQFKSLKEIQAARKQVVWGVEFELAKDEWLEQFESFYTSLGLDRPSSDLFELMGDLFLGQVPRAKLLSKEMYSLEFTEEQSAKFQDLMDKLVELPTEYFEAKPQRVVQLSEFKAAVVPSNVKPEVLEVLKKHGIKSIHKYDGESKGAGRSEAIARAAETTQVLFHRKDQSKTPRGYVKVVSDSLKQAYNIVLNTRKADRSTFLHETGHTFLFMMERLAARPEASERLRRDWEKTKVWLEWKEGQTKLTDDQHEKFAYGFEKYLFEGKAPSEDLVGIFTSFRLWLTEVYRRIKPVMNVELSDDIRGVFDRLLATDEELQQQQENLGRRPIWRSPEEANASPEEWAELVDAQVKAESTARRYADLRVLKDQLRETERWFKEERAQVKKEFELKFEMRRDVRARLFLRTGELRTDSGTVETTVTDAERRLDWESVAGLVGEENAKRLRRFTMKATKEATANHPDAIAPYFGFETGQQMLEALLNIPDQKEWVRDQVDTTMAERHGDVVHEQDKLRELVGKGLHQDETAHWLLKEMQLLKKKVTDPTKLNAAGVPMPVRGAPIEAIELAARRMVAKQNVRKLNVAAAARAERKAADDALKASARGNFAQAYAFKQRQLLSFYMYRELTKAKETREELVDLAGDLSQGKSRARLGKASPAYRDVVDRITEGLGLKEVELRDKELADIGTAVAQMEANGEVVAFDPLLLQSILVKHKDYRELTVEQLQEVLDALKNIRQAARNLTTVLIDGKRVEKELLVDELITEMTANLPYRGPFVEPQARTQYEKLIAWVSAFDGSQLRTETMVEFLGGASTESRAFRALIKPMLDAKAKEHDLHEKTVAPIMAALAKMPRRMRHRLFQSVDGRKLFPNHRTDLEPPRRRYELIALVLNAGNESNLKRLTEGRGITRDQVQEVIDMLDLEELQWIQSVLDAMESLWPEAAALEERDTGLRPSKIPASAIVSAKHGAFRGGYYPAVYPKGLTAVGERQAGETIASFQDPTFTRGSTTRNHLKGRAENFADALSFDLDVIAMHLNQVVHDIAFREPLKSVGGLLLTTEVRNTMRERLGYERSEKFIQWAKDIGADRGAQISPHAKEMTIFLDNRKAALGPAILGYGVDIVLGDASNPLMAVIGTALKPHHAAAGMAEFAANPLDSVAFVRKMSGEFRTRDNEYATIFRRKLKALSSRQNIVYESFAAYEAHAFKIFEWSEKVTTTGVWIGAFRQAQAEGKNEADSVVFADAVMRQVLPAQSVVDKPEMLRGRGAVSILLQFHGYMNTTYNLYRRAAHPLYLKWMEAADGADSALGRVVRGVGGLAASTVPITVAARVLGITIGYRMIAEVFSGKGPKASDGEDEWSRWAKWGRHALIMGPLGSVVGVGMAFDLMTGNRPSMRTAPHTAFADSILQAVRKVKSGEASEWDKVLAVVKAAGMIRGTPVSRPLRAVDYIHDVLEGDAEAGPLQTPAGIIYGNREDQGLNPLSLPAALTEGR